MKILLILWFLLSTKFLLFTQANEVYPCGLSWTSTSRGSQNSLEYPVKGDGRNEYVSRILLAADDYDLGRVNSENGNGYFPNSLAIVTTYEILTNLYDCNVEWVSPANSYVSQFVVKSTSSASAKLWVGRGELPDGTLVPGSFNPATNSLTLVDSEGTQVILTSNYDLLVSYSNGMELEITDVVFDTDPYSGPVEMLGMDVIDNDGEATVTQSVEHMKATSESYRFTTSRITSVKTYSFRWCLFFCSKTEKTTQSSTTTTEFSSHQEKEIKVSRSFKVPPMTAVESCSTFSKQDNFESTWTAKAIFTSKGKSGEEILEVLNSDPNWASRNLTATLTTVETEIVGTFRGAFVATSRMYIVDKSSGSCSQLAEYLKQTKSESRNAWTLQDSIKQQLEIAEIFKHRNKEY